MGAGEVVSPYSSGVLDEETELEWFFPVVDPLHEPLGARVLVQIRRVKERTKSGIYLASDTKSAEAWNTQVGKIIKLGPLAFCNRETMKPWIEGVWAKPGDYVRVPRYGGDRWSVDVNDGGPQSPFIIVNDHEIIALITGDPRKVRAFIE